MDESYKHNVDSHKIVIKKVHTTYFHLYKIIGRFHHDTNQDCFSLAE